MKLFSLTDINECEVRPCKNGGTCTDLVNDRRCACVPGYTGKSCEISKFTFIVINGSRQKNYHELKFKFDIYTQWHK